MSKGIVICKLWKRQGKPSVNAPKNGKYISGDEVEILDVVLGDTDNDYYEGTPTWYKLAGDIYIWSGGVSMDLQDEIFVRKVNYDRNFGEEQGEETGAMVSQYPWPIKTFSIFKVWETLKGRGVKIGLLDTGVDNAHPGLSHAIAEGYNFYAKNNDFSDWDGHGTHCAGIIASNGKENMYGISPESRLYVGKIMNYTTSGIIPEVLVRAFNWLISKGVHVISISAGIDNPSEQLLDVIKKCIESNILVVAAIGNYGPASNGLYPALYPECISVGAIDEKMVLWDGTSRSNLLAINAPGVDIHSTYKNGTYETLSGTSMAVPWVAGLAALYKQKKSDLNVKAFKGILLEASLSKRIDDFNYSIVQPQKLFGL